ncbi:MAG: DNA polymerase IV [Oscillospiraceae bacterium]|nr:DNA polymerase IV [Oscillospiraceae bacterium]
MNKRTILHIDGDAFYASVELLHNPALRGKPMAVGGDVEARHGIVLAKSPEAKRCGVKTGMALWQARQCCPDIIFMPPNFEQYLRFSRLLREIIGEYTDLIESFGLDECWADLSLLGDGEYFAQRTRRQVRHELGITVSVGVSWNKIFAKLGSDQRKPDGQFIITRENVKQTVWPLPAEDLLGVGRATTRKLHNLGLRTIGDIATTPPEILQSHLHKWGLYLHAFANGLDDSPVTPSSHERAIKSVGNSWTTPRDLLNEQDCHIVFTGLAESVAERLRELGLCGKVVQISLRDSELHSFERQLTLQKPTCLASELSAATMQLLRAHYDWQKPLRSIGLRAAQLVPAIEQVQLSLFDDEQSRLRQESIERTVDGLRRRFGHHAIAPGLMGIDRQLGRLNAKADHTIHPVGYF